MTQFSDYNNDTCPRIRPRPKSRLYITCTGKVALVANDCKPFSIKLNLEDPGACALCHHSAPGRRQRRIFCFVALEAADSNVKRIVRKPEPHQGKNQACGLGTLRHPDQERKRVTSSGNLPSRSIRSGGT